MAATSGLDRTWWRVRRAARRHRDALGDANDDSGAEAVLQIAAAACGLRCSPRPPADPLLSGAHAVLDIEAATIWVRDDVAAGARRLLIAHELAHFHLHHNDLSEDDDLYGCAENDLEIADAAPAEMLVGYGPRERREAEANVFAREFLLPLPTLRRWFWDEGGDAETIARRAGLPLSLVLSQLADALTADPPTDDLPADSPPLLQGLDVSQRAAACAPRGPLLVGAGPGTGKTRTLAARALFLTQQESVAPESLLALTFSRRAAEEMRERIAAQAPEVARRAFITTFHAFGLDLLRRHSEAAGLPPRPVLLDPVGAFALLERRVAVLNLSALRYLHDPAFPLPEMLRAIARAKEEMRTPADFATDAEASGDDRLRETAGVYAAYEALLAEKGALDFADLVARPVRLLQARPDILRAERARWRHVLVDEYQDVNRAGARLIQLLAGEGGGLWAVGDLRQAIYAFRGASPANVTRFETDFPHGRRSELGVNYRSGASLVGLFGAACGEGATAWQAVRNEIASATLAVADDDAAQADQIAARMRRFRDDGRAWGDQAILCRTRGQAAALRQELVARGIPVAAAPEEQGLFARSDVKNLLALLSRVAEPDGPARHRVPDLPPGLTAAGDAWDTLMQALFGPPGGARHLAEPHAVAGLLSFARAFRDRAGSVLDENEEPRRAFLEHVRQTARLGAAPTAVNRADEDAVAVLTIHASKGLEFPVVFVPNLSQGKFPARPAPSLLPPVPRPETSDDADEEARLFFVALTRARDHLVLSRAQKYNNRAAAPSPLLACLDDAPGLHHETWTTGDTIVPPAAEIPPSETPVLPAPGDKPHLEAWEAELYMRCPRRFYYERVLLLPTGDAAPYAGFKRAMQRALASPDPRAALTDAWDAVGPAPDHPHATLYRRAAEELVERAPAAPPAPRDRSATLAVELENGVVSVHADRGDGSRVERHTFRKPPKSAEDKIPAEPRLSLLQEAAPEHAAVHVRFLRTGETRPVSASPRQRAKHLAGYDAALRGVRLQMFPASPDDPTDCPACPFYFICPA